MSIKKLGSIKLTDDVVVGSTNLASEVSGILGVANGGTGQSVYTDGQLLIGNTTGNTLTKATLTAGANITITNGPGSITIASTGGGGLTPTTVGANLYTLPDPNAIGFIRINADNTVSALNAAGFRDAIQAFRGDNAQLANTDLNSMLTSGYYWSNTLYSTNTNIPYANYFVMLNLTQGEGRRAQLWFADTPSTSGGVWWRPRQGDATGWHPWEKFLTSANYGSYALPLGGGTVTGLTSFTAAESLNLYGIRGLFSAGSDGQGIHLFSNVVIGDPTGWGNGLSVTPSRGLATWGAINVAYGNSAASTFNGRTLFVPNGRGPTYTQSSIELYTGDNTPPGIAFHRGGVSATLLYEYDGELYVNAWTTRPQTGKLLSAGNYGSYALPLSGGEVAGILNSSDIRSQSQIRATGWYNVNSGTYTGLGTEIGVSGGESYLLSYNRDAGTYGIFNVNATSIRLVPVGGNLTGPGGNVILHAGNYSSYALPLSGGTLTGNLTMNGAGSSTSIIFGESTKQINVEGYWMMFKGHQNEGFRWQTTDGSTYTTRMQLTSSQLTLTNGLTVQNSTSAITLASGYTIGMGDWGLRNTTPYGWIQFGPANAGWAHIYADRTFYFNQELYVNGNQVLHAANYNSYAPSLTGAGASGSSWGISITGNAATAAEAQNNYFYVRGTSPSVLFVDTDQGETRYVHHNGGSIGFLNSSGNWVLRCDNSTTHGTFAGSLSGNASTASNVAASGITGQTGMWTSAARPGPYRLYRNESDDPYNIQTTWSADRSGYWSLRGYYNDSYHAACYVAYSGYADSAGSAGGVAWSNVSSKPSFIAYYQGFTLDANTMDTNATGFTYSVNAPYTGPITRISAGGGYDLWFNAPYYSDGNALAFRTRNGDTGTNNSWWYVLHNGNYNSYSPTLTGGGASGTWGISISGTATNGRYVYDNGAYSGSTGYVEASSMHVYYSYLGRLAYNNGAYSGSGWVEPSDLGVRYANTAGSAPANGGTATALNGSNYISRTGSSGNYNTDFNNTPAGTVRHLGDDPNIANSPGGTWWFVDNYRHSNSSNYWGTQIAWGWEDNANRLAQRNVTGGSWSGWVYYLNSSNYSSYALPLSGGTVTGNTTFNAQVYCYDWFRSYNATGWYNQTYGGGIWMQDSTWVRVYGTKDFYATSNIAAVGNVTAYYSDERLKTSRGRITDALKKVRRLTGFYYVENDTAREVGYKNEREQVGVSAQQVQAELPHAVSLAPFDMHTNPDTGEITSKSGENYLTVDYSRLVPLLIEAIKELADAVEGRD